MHETVRPCSLPPQALLRPYARDGGFTDCFTVDLPLAVSQAEFVKAFYTTPLFKLERMLLTLAGHRATDEQAAQLGLGEAKGFSAWQVEAQQPDQILLASGPTRSWLMARPTLHGQGWRTTLYFGSAIVPRKRRDGTVRMGPGFEALLGFHTWYSKALLRAARSRLLLRRAGA